MRYFIFSDVHANLEALDAVLSAIAEEQVNRIIFLGDIVGYGAHHIASRSAERREVGFFKFSDIPGHVRTFSFGEEGWPTGNLGHFAAFWPLRDRYLG